jgi:uncharacterized protein YidB (DUF937 family)
MSFFTEIVKSAMGASTSADQGQAETQTQHLLNALLRILLAMGGVDGLVNKFQQAGLGDLAASWVGIGKNKSLMPDQLTHVLGKDQVAALAHQMGIPESQGALVLSQILPAVVDKLTPDGKAPESSNLETLGKVLLGGMNTGVAASFFGDKEDKEQSAGSK